MIGQEKYITMDGRSTWVKSVITSQAIHHLTSLVVPKGLMASIVKLQRAFLWGGTDKVSGGKCKIRWEKVCMPKDMGGLGILDMEKFARALRLRWPWLVWKDAERAWVDFGHPCDEEDMSSFYECTSITVGNGQRASFWHSPWLGGRKPKDIAPSIFAISKHKNDTIHRALDLNNWIANINTNSGLTIQLILEYYELWVGLREVFLDEGVDDEIVWKLSPSGEYTTSSAYKAQLDDSTASKMKSAVWNNWAPPKHKFFAWLIIQDRVWTTDRLQRRG